MNLSSFLRHQMEQRGWSLRDAEREIGVSRSAIDNILKDEGIVPSLDTLAKLAIAFNVSLARVVELCGFDLGDSRSPNERLSFLLESLPEFQAAIDHLLQLESGDLKGVLDYIAWVVERRDSIKSS